MKKIFFGMVALVAMVATSCQQTPDLAEVGLGGEAATVEFNLGTPQISNRAVYSNGEAATHLQWAVYDANGNILSDLTGEKTDFQLSTTVKFQLTTGNTYYVLFWAAAEDAPYTVDLAAKTMEVNYTGAVSNDEKRDAFYYYDDFTVANGMDPIKAELKRPFAQLNIGTDDFAASEKAGHKVTHAMVEVPAYSKLNFADGVVEGKAVRTFAYAAVPGSAYEFPVNDTKYDYIAMNYLLMANTKETVDVKFTYAKDATGANAKTRTVGSVPVCRNYRTNLYGQLFTSDATVNVEIKPEYDGAYDNEYDYYVDNGVYHITTANGLKWFAEKVNSGELLNATVVLDSDINLSATSSRATTYTEWEPIGNGTHWFGGTFDGAGHKVYNFQVTTKEGHAGLFGYARAEIKNLTVENVKIVANHYAGAIVGQGYMRNIDKCHVNNIDITLSVKNGDWGDKAGGIIGQNLEGNSATSMNIKNCSAKNVSIKGYRDLGGIAGMVSNYNVVSGCSVENITLVQDLSVNYESTTPTTLAALVGRLGNDKVGTYVTLENNTVNGEALVSVEAKSATEMKEAIKAGAETIAVANEIDLAGVSLSGYSGTIVGIGEGAAISTRNFTPSSNEAYWVSGNITFKNLDVKLPTGGDWLQSGFASDHTLVFDNCNFEGQVTLNSHGTGVFTFNDCTFVSTESGKYASFVYGVQKAIYNRCQFSGVDRAAKVYGSGGDLDVEYNDCTFTSTTENKAGVEIDATYATTTVALNGCSQTAMKGLYAVEGTKGIVSVDGKIETVAGGSAAVESTEDLKSALTSGQSVVGVAAGTYTFPASSVAAGTTIICE